MKRLSLSTIGRITTPAAMVVFMAYEINRSMDVTGGWEIAILVGAIATAVGVEIVGIQSGSTLEGFWRQGNTYRALLSFVLLCIYTMAAIHILRNNETLLPVPIVAAIVYIVSALADSLVSQEAKQEVVEADERELDRRLRVARIKMEHEEKLAQIQANSQERIAAKEIAAQTKIERERAKIQSASIEPAQSKSEPAVASYECEDCGKGFGSVQALNAHGRFCPARVPGNGKVRS